MITSMLQKFTSQNFIGTIFLPPIGRQTLIGDVHQGGDLGYPTSAICEGNIPTFLQSLSSRTSRGLGNLGLLIAQSKGAFTYL